MGHRQRPCDDKKNLKVINDLEAAKKTASPEELKELEALEQNLDNVIKYYDSRKKIHTPDSILIENNKLINKKKQNNNIIKNDMPTYELKEYKRPDNYIIYDQRERDQIKKRTKDYEAKYSDNIFLNFHGDFMKIEVLEQIICKFENFIGKGENISEEAAKKIIDENFSEYSSKSNLIIKHYNDRRNELKRSLLRKFWKIQKTEDKNLNITFRKREKEKMKTRKNNHNLNNAFEEIKMAGKDL